jgi:hypothetical protein
MMPRVLYGLMVGFVVAACALPVPVVAMEADQDLGAGTAQTDAYAARLWEYLLENNLVGEGRMRSYPFVGSRPHGSIQEVIATEAEMDGRTGRMIVKHNYGAAEELTPRGVYGAEQDENYEAITIMFQREQGYDPANNDWFWAEYNPDGSILIYQGAHLSGRSPVCLGCHTPLGGEDREIINGTGR